MAASTTPKSCFEKVLSPPPPFLISQRAQGTLAFPTFSSQLADQLFNNLYDRDSNPKGVVQLALSINQLMEEEVLARVNQGHTLTLTPQHQYYNNSSGLLELRTALANFLTRHHKPSQAISPDNLIVMNGVTACFDALSHALCDPGDVVLTPTPVYARVYTNFRDRSGATVVPLPCPETDNFALQEGAMESLIKKHMEGGQRVRVCVLLHPHNPLGRIYSTQELQNILKLCAQYQIHVVIDEIYAFSVHDESTEFNSVLGMESVPDPDRTHVLWGFSKDFALPGFRIGVIHTTNPWVLSCLRTLSHYHSSPPLTQHAAATLLNDVEWCDDFYIPTNKERLAASYKKARECLEACGAKVHRSVAGIFLWVNFQAFLDECTEQCEIDLFMAFLKGGVCILPGQKLYCAHPGWYRIVYSARDDVLEEGLARIQAVLSQWKKNKKSETT
ncbi:1-aminocyclopropane-1-carboxylate synthase-like protein 1 [Chionoecetes opilio]|uniref:1-aminocyclopropane-1-carboxylate synthase-like protein 1 n=1 Tax=Chionoecetes opilio TaxID=41210 RepID=A0A8J4YAV6_CHIOP|nr:1-aminocyclopropane-1-carboxylate synthase-like protein 1 [Chionoecetes opilio]